MKASRHPHPIKRYQAVTEEKSGRAIYTPRILSDFVAHRIVEAAGRLPTDRPLRVLDPAIGRGELLVSLLEALADRSVMGVEVCGFETDPEALDAATERLAERFPGVSLHFELGNFLELVLERPEAGDDGPLFHRAAPTGYDLIIANPPYVRIQIMGAARAQLLAKQFGLEGRVDLYYAFVLGMSQMLRPQGIAGIIVSNRFMTTKSGGCVRRALSERFDIRHIWDLGDTKLFDVAVLPAVLLAEGIEGRNGRNLKTPAFTSIYQSADPATDTASDPVDALSREGVVEVEDGRRFRIQHGKLGAGGASDGVWRIASDSVDAWLATVDARSWGTFRDIGKVRVGVKTCADKVFIRNDWQDLPNGVRPELLKPLATHHVARRFKALEPDQPSQIFYPHEVVEGRRRAVDLACHPRSRTYLEAHRRDLESRRYVMEAGREWYEIWVPQDPDAWSQPKLVFRDIAEDPVFWIDLDGFVVNGDCYWLASQNSAQTDLLWLAAAVGNSTFIERFYDLRFHNKLYAGRRRFITQYVEQFPLPDPHGRLGQAIVAKAKRAYECTPSLEAERLQKDLDALVWDAFTGNEPD